MPPAQIGTRVCHYDTHPCDQCSMIGERKMQERTRNYATVVYPESAPDNWKGILEDHCVPAFISPLHNKDIDLEGNLKKEHFHVMILFEACKTKEQAKEIFDSIGGVGVEIVKNTKAYSRYLCHLDNKDKAQYDIKDVISLSGADYNTMITLARDKYTAIGEMIEFCIANDVFSYAMLLLYAKKNRHDWFKVLCDSGTLTIVQFLKSRSWEVEKLGGKKGL